MKTINFDETKWTLVPVEPTEEMLAAAHEGDRQYTLRVFGDIPTVQQGAHDHWVAMLAAAPTQPECEHNNAPAVPQDMRLVPVWLLERVEQSLGSFTSDEGWSQSDMDTMDSVSAMLAATPATAAALQGILACFKDHRGYETPALRVAKAYEYADEMLKQRNQ